MLIPTEENPVRLTFDITQAIVITSKFTSDKVYLMTTHKGAIAPHKMHMDFRIEVTGGEGEMYCKEVLKIIPTVQNA